VRRKAWYNFTMVVVVATAVLIPAVILYLATDLHEVVSFWPHGFHVDTRGTRRTAAGSTSPVICGAGIRASPRPRASSSAELGGGHVV
jgi:hypothetical protein